MKATLLLSLAMLAPAQYRHLTTDRHGTKVAFSTNLTLLGEQRNDLPKLLELSAGGFLRTLRSEAAILNPGDRAPVNFPSLAGPEFSSDGRLLAFTGDRWCIGGSGCVAVERTRGSVLWMDNSREAPNAGAARISANGEWAVYANPTSLASPYRFYRVHLPTGRSEFARTGLSGMPGTGRRIVADDGTTLSAIGQTLIIRKPNAADQEIRLPFSVASIVISNNAQYAVAQTSGPAPLLWWIDLFTLQSVPVVWAAEGASQPALSDDGMTLMFLSGANWAAQNDSLAVQAWTMDMTTGRLRQWTKDPAGLAEVTISGDARVAWASTMDGRLLRIDSSAGEVQTLLGPIPHLEEPESVVWSPGSRYRLEGAGLTGATLRWHDTEMSLIHVDAKSVEFIIPWETALGTGKLEAHALQSPFQPFQLSGEMKRLAPRFLKTRDYIDGLRSDGSPLTTENPAAPGEMIRLLMTGLGPVYGSGQTLETPLVTVEGQLPVDVLEAMVDLGTPGTYRLTLRVPFHLTGSALFSVQARGVEQAEDSGWVPVQPR